MSKHHLKFALTTLVLAGGCSQILGISDYEIDSQLDDPSPSLGGDGNQAGDGTEGGSGGTKGGTDNRGGDPGLGGDGPLAGSGSLGGDGPIGGSGDGGSSEGGAPAGVLVPCDSADCCTAEGGTPVLNEVLQDGGFEEGTAEEGKTPWIEVSSNDYALITDGISEKIKPHAGTYLSFLCGVDDEISSLQSANLAVPQTAGWFEVSGYRWFEIDGATLPANEDFMSLSLFNSVGDELDELVDFWDSTEDYGDTTRWTSFTYSVDAAPHRGKSMYLLLLCQTDLLTDGTITGKGSNYLFDDLSLKIGRCYK